MANSLRAAIVPTGRWLLLVHRNGTAWEHVQG